MTEDDLLGSFFSEINSVAAAGEGPVTETKIASPVSEPVVAVQAVAVAAVSHPVYNYSEAVIGDAKKVKLNEPMPSTVISSSLGSIDGSLSSSNTPHDVNSLSSFSHSAYSSVTTTAANAPVAPHPFAPRKEKTTFVRKAAGETWTDDTLNEWPENDFRLFVGDLAKEVTQESLAAMFTAYKSFAKAKIIRSKWDCKARGYGFVSFLDPMDCAHALREMNGKYLLSRPMKIRKSTWKDLDIKGVQKKEKNKRKMQESLGLV